MKHIEIDGALWPIIAMPLFAGYDYEVSARATLSEIINAIETQHEFKLKGMMRVHVGTDMTTLYFDRFI